MRESFDKLKRKYRLKALISSLCGGVCCALFVTGALLVVLKLCSVALGWYIYLLVGVCSFILSGGIIYLATRKTDEKLAKKLDKTYSLDEKTQTMVEYGGKQGAMLDMQRQDTELALQSIPRARPSVLSVILRIVAGVIAVALFVTGVIIPQPEAPSEQQETPYSIEQEKIEKLNSLILDVQGDDILVSAAQDYYLNYLTTLRADVVQATSAAQVTELVQDAMYDIATARNTVNTYDDFSYMLSLTGLSYIADGLRDSITAYSKDLTITEYSELVAAYADGNFDIAIRTLMLAATETFEEDVNALDDSDGNDKATVQAAVEVYTAALSDALSCDRLLSYYTELSSQITFGGARGDATSGDSLYDSVYDFYYNINSVLDFYSGNSYMTYNLDTLKEKLAQYASDNKSSDFATTSSTALKDQSYTCMADSYIREQLASIFGVAITDNAASDGDTSSGDSGDSGDGGSGSGGGTGETIYPGSDMIYNPETGEYTFYIDMLERLNDLLTDPDTSDEIKLFLSEYLSNLYGND